MRPDFDIAICGAGPVGMALAALLVLRGTDAQRIALIDAKTLGQSARDPRSLALSYGSRQILAHAGGWPTAATPIRQIHISRRGQFGRTVIDADEYHLPALGYVTRYGQLTTALAAAPLLQNVKTLRPAEVTSVTEHAHAVSIALGNAPAVSASIVVQAEGGLFADQTIRPLNRRYDQTAIVATVRCSRPLPRRAFERFTSEGPLALLPQDDGYALVWCVLPATAQTLLALDEEDFLRELHQAFGDRLGRFTASTARLGFPLGLNAHPATTARTVTIGNAAQTLHPVAGQGLNLGLRDATVLARLLAQEPSAAGLQQFAHARRQDRDLTIRLTDTMARIFAGAADAVMPQSALGLSLSLIDAVKPAKRLLAEQMMFGRR